MTTTPNAAGMRNAVSIPSSGAAKPPIAGPASTLNPWSATATPMAVARRFEPALAVTSAIPAIEVAPDARPWRARALASCQPF